MASTIRLNIDTAATAIGSKLIMLNQRDVLGAAAINTVSLTFEQLEELAQWAAELKKKEGN